MYERPERKQAVLCMFDKGNVDLVHFEVSCLHRACPELVQLVAAVISAAVKNDGDRGWTSFVLLIVELNIIVWVSTIAYPAS